MTKEITDAHGRTIDRVLRAIAYNCGLLSEKTYPDGTGFEKEIDDALDIAVPTPFCEKVKEVVTNLYKKNPNDVFENDMTWECYNAIIKDCNWVLRTLRSNA